MYMQKVCIKKDRFCEEIRGRETYTSLHHPPNEQILYAYYIQNIMLVSFSTLKLNNTFSLICFLIFNNN